MKRIQRKRTKGYKQPPNTKYCGRPSKYGNTYHIGLYSASLKRNLTIDECIERYRNYANAKIKAEPDWLDELKKYDYLSCFCPLDKPCHVDVLIELLK